MKSFLTMKSVPQSTDAGLLVLRVWLGLSMLGLHGWGKLQKLIAGDTAFASVFGMSQGLSLTLATAAEAGAATLIVIGLATRWSALMLFINLSVAFVVAHSGKLTGPGNGELAFIYMAGAAAILLAGPGKYSVDSGMK